MPIPVRERRSRRSPWASEALHLQLLRAVEEHQLQALVLSDNLGQIWAASSRQPTAKAISPGPLPEEGPDLQRRQRGGVPVLVRRLRVGPAVLYLSAPGRATQAPAALERAAAGVERILGSLL